MNQIRYKCDARTKTFLMLWLGFGFNLMAETEWSQIDWKEIEIRVFKLQKRIYRASLSGDVAKVHKLQRLLLRSWCAKLLAVRRISQDNQGKNTAGIDGVKTLSPKQRLNLAENLTLTGKGKSLRRVWIPKPGRKEKRGLGIPVMEDRARQALLKLALEPEWEAKFEPNSYGFRPGRSCHDAEEAIYKTIKTKAKWVLDADISKCFDRINHNVLLRKLNTTPTMARQIRAWLKSGVLDRGDWFPTNEGTPQGGVISPLLANIALHGLEENIRQWAETWKGNKQANSKSISLIRYADDFVVLHKDKSIIQQAKTLIEQWLHGLGLELSESKTRICHTLHNSEKERAGFDFLGWNIRQYEVGKNHTGKNTNGKLLGFKTIIKPSDKSIKTHYEKIVSVLDSMKGKSQEVIIDKLNPIIRGWCNYHKTVCSKETFAHIDYMVYNKLRRWIKSRHSNKTLKWCEERYFHLTKEKDLAKEDRKDKWVFSTPSDTPNSPIAGTHELWKHAWTPIERHIKIEGTKSPYDGDWRYWSKRRGEYPGTPKRVATLMKRQKGKCARCGLYIKGEDVVEVDHIVPKAEGGKDHYKNLQLLHRHCHHQKTAEDRQRQMDNKGQKKTQKKTKKSRKSETKQGSAVNTA
ncbi:group II intron reverse transcriptase/maturase [Dactylococcopsis salina]|uniref:Retron-type reverse transcriptase n=1 Tax=Dactylococcopsis salina (strain PCC 8305) TaxID=13035 RepID=K9YYY0_DACS8|nr:group II intron reverse transcriptase/maturase [Dactylococcopsis salina]AFZ49363.1 Retron-type reverse transcriptase [Dactylococcopsis salina PCC 8305]AFZ51530.1 Retron-type reverse transcriptase [Dactylococcopsis salina PCC 8305]